MPNKGLVKKWEKVWVDLELLKLNEIGMESIEMKWTFEITLKLNDCSTEATRRGNEKEMRSKNYITNTYVYIYIYIYVYIYIYM